MRLLVSPIIVLYLVGVGVVLAPTIQGKWNESTAAQFSASVGQALPHALAWPAGIYRSVTGEGETGSMEPQAKTP